MSQTLKRNLASNEITQAIRDYKGFRTRWHKMLMVFLCSHGNSDGTNIYPGRKALAIDMMCSVSTVKRLLKDLEDDQFIFRLERKGGRFKETAYFPNFVKLGLAIEDTTPLQEVVPPPAPPAQNGRIPPDDIEAELERYTRFMEAKKGKQSVPKS